MRSHPKITAVVEAVREKYPALSPLDSRGLGAASDPALLLVAAAREAAIREVVETLESELAKHFRVPGREPTRPERQEAAPVRPPNHLSDYLDEV